MPFRAPWRRRDAAGRLTRALLRHRHRLLPAISFVAGWASYVLVERSAAMAQAIAAMVLAGWLWILAEGALGSLLTRMSRGRLSPALLRMVTQSLHQETLFFALPFVWAATVWQSSQPVFAVLVVLAAAATTVDRIYLDRICARPTLALAFQGFCAFVAALVVVPVALQRDTGSALGLAAGLMLLCLLPMVLRRLVTTPLRRLPRAALLLTATLAAGWTARGTVPPVGLETQSLRATQTLSMPRTPGAAIDHLDTAALRAEGLYTFAAVRAPLGLRQDLVFEWRHEGVLVERIATEIRGGREAGYRTWSRKQHFPADSAGEWRIALRTAAGQMLGETRVRVTPDGTVTASAGAAHR